MTEPGGEPRHGAPANSASGDDTPSPAGSPTPNEPPYLRLPLPLVAGGLLAVLVIALAAGLYANRTLRPQSTPIVAPATAAQPALTVASAVTLAPTAAPAALAAQATATPQPIARPAITPLGVGTPVPAAATVLQTPPPPALTAIAAPPALPTVDPSLADEVGKAYLAFWQVRSHALLELDTEHLPEVMDAEYLSDVTNIIDRLVREGRAIKTQATLNYNVVEVNDATATVVDDIVDNSIYVKPGTEEPLSDSTADELSVLYRLRKMDGTWKVVTSARQR